MKMAFAFLGVFLVAAAFVPGIVQSASIPVENIDPKGMLGPNNPMDAGQIDDAPAHGGIYIVKEPDDRWHIVGAGILPWGGTDVEMVAAAVNADGAKGKITPQGEYTADNPGDVFDSPEGGQIDWAKIEGNEIYWLSWYNGTGAWDGVWFKAEGDFVVFETLGLNNDATGPAGDACGKFGDRGCLVKDPLPPAPKERIFIGGEKPDEYKNPSTEAPFALKNRPDAPSTITAVELKDKVSTTWGTVKNSRVSE